MSPPRHPVLLQLLLNVCTKLSTCSVSVKKTFLGRFDNGGNLILVHRCGVGKYSDSPSDPESEEVEVVITWLTAVHV